MQAAVDCITCEPGHLTYKKGDVIKLKPEKMASLVTSLPAPRAGKCYHCINLLAKMYNT